MKIHKYILKTLNAVVDYFVIIVLILIGSYAAFALWDNNQIYEAAENIQQEILKYKPESTTDEDNAFDELREINPSICAWLILDGTGIDCPIVQGKNNIEYLNKDIYGNFAIAGSIFLDTRCNNEFKDAYSLIYGHQMSDGSMFGDLLNYKKSDFFNENKTGTLILPDRTYTLKIYACLLISASDNVIFNPESWSNDITGLLDYTEEKAVHMDKDVLQDARAQSNPLLVALSTCSYEFSDARTVVLAIMEPCENE